MGKLQEKWVILAENQYSGIIMPNWVGDAQYYMDFTAEKPIPSQAQSGNEKFYSIHSIVQLNESAMNQLAHITSSDINSQILYNYEVSDESSNPSKTNSRDNVGEIVATDQGKACGTGFTVANKGSCDKMSFGGGTFYASIDRKQDEYLNSCNSNDSKQEKRSPNKVSLLETSLRLEKRVTKQSQKGQRNQQQPKTSTTPLLQQGKMFDPSIEKTQLSDKFQIKTPSISMTLQEKEKQQKVLGAKAVQKYKKQKQPCKRQQQQSKTPVHGHPSAILLNILTQQLRKSFTFNELANMAPQPSLPNQKNAQQFTATCLFRLPTSPSILQQVAHTNSEVNCQLYYKYPFTLTKMELRINNSYSIRYENVSKIKVIHSELNRPQIKIVYAENLGDPEQKSKRLSKSDTVDGKYRESRKDEEWREGELILFMCECYETIFMVFAWVIYYKLIGQMGNKADHKTHERKTDISRGDKSPTKDWKSMNFNFQIEGHLMKKSKYLKNWQKRYIKIKNFVLNSHRISVESPHKKQKNGVVETVQKISKQSTFELENIRELWTRFEILEGEYLVLKCFKKNKMEKFQFGIPIMNYYNYKDKNNWMFAFVTMLRGQP